MASSIIRRISASETAETTSLMWNGRTPAWWSVTTVERRRLAASRSSSLVARSGDGPAKHEGGAGLRGDEVDGDDHAQWLSRTQKTGTCRMSWSSMVSITSAPVWSPPTPITGALIAAFTGSSGESRPATTGSGGPDR